MHVVSLSEPGTVHCLYRGMWTGDMQLRVNRALIISAVTMYHMDHRESVAITGRILSRLSCPREQMPQRSCWLAAGGVPR